MKEIRDRKMGELMLEEIFIAPKNSNSSLLDYADLRRWREKYTFQILYSWKLDISNGEAIAEFKKELSNIFCNTEFTAGLMEFAEDTKGHSAPSTLFEEICRLISYKKPFEWHPFIHMSDELDCNEIMVNVYMFSEKSNPDNLADTGIEKMLDAYKDIVLLNQAEECSCGELLPLKEFDADERLKSYTSLLSCFTVNDDTANFIMKIIRDATSYIKKDTDKGFKIEISTLQEFMFHARELLMHLTPYYPPDELDKISHQLKKILPTQNGNDSE